MTVLSRIVNNLADVAPGLAGMFGGPLAGAAALGIKKALGLGTGATEGDILAGLQSATPKQQAALKSLQIELLKTKTDYLLGVEKVAADDRASARAREKDVGGIAVPLLAGIILAASFLVVILILSGVIELNDENNLIVGTILGMVNTMAGQVISYYFGSSAGSANKDKAIRSYLED